MPAIQISKDAPGLTIRVIASECHESPDQPDYVDGFADSVREMQDKFGRWGWCDVEVRATFAGLTASDHLGCCSYESADDFKLGGYYEQMEQEAIDRLQSVIDDVHARINV